MNASSKFGRYSRIYEQLEKLLQKTDDIYAKMATVCAVLHHKMHFFWTGFYLLRNGELIIGPYQGPVACQVLEKNKGVCWATINQAKTIVVPDVNKFPGHIACDTRSKSEIAVPLGNKSGEIIGVLDIDNVQPGSFDEIDRENLEKIVGLI
ncbi:MAG: GAF domain-containing protein [Bacteroidota bacterium]